MSFSYKTLNSNDITLTSYIANKQWEANSSSLSQNGVTIYVGENLPVTKDNPFNPIDDTQTSNDEYRRLVFESIKHLYYENYTSASLTGQFFQSSSYFNYEQSTLVSGTIRNLTTITGSNLNPNIPVIYDDITSQSLFDKASTLYDLSSSLDPDEGSRVVIISIDKKIYGSGLSPKSVNISGSTYNIQDDGEGNLLDTLATSSLYIGNVFYSQGLIIITDQNYLCILGIPPTAVNDYFSYDNTTSPPYLDILGNDFTDCGNINYTSFSPNNIPGYTFPNYTQNNGLITITPDQTSVIPGNYQLGYTIASTTGIRSNTASISLTINSQPLEISNIINGFTCYGTSSLVPVTCSISYGIPYYSWSFDGGINYSSSNSLIGITVSGSVLSSTNNLFYVKDYTGNIYSSSFNSWYPALAPGRYYGDFTPGVDIQTPFYTTPLCSSTASNGTIYIKRGTATQASVNGGAFTNLSKFDPGTAFTNATTASTIIYKNAVGCTTSSIFNIPFITSVTASFTTSSATCYEGTNGTATFAFTNALSNNYYEFYKNGVGVVQAYLVSPSASVTFTNLEPTSSYELELFSETPYCDNQHYYKSFTVGRPNPITFSASASYIDSCSNAVTFSATGGTPPYTYFAADTGSGVTYSSDSSSVSLTSLSGSVYSLSVIDNNGCSSSSSLLTVFGRQYEYSGSVCSGSTGYVSSSAIHQKFNYGPYSGSVVTSSYSSGSILIGPTIDFKQSFVSGTIDSILPCQGLSYYRLNYDPVTCPPGGCVIPVLTSATVTSCNAYDGNYNIYYNSGSTNAVYTYIQYSTSPTFFYKLTSSSLITNASPTILPINVNNLPLPPSSPFTIVYFRAYNSCSSGFGTSSFSNTLTASCIPPPTPTYSSFTLQVKNHATNSIRYTNPLTGTVISVSNNQSSSFNFSTETTSTQIAISGTPSGNIKNPNNLYDYYINVYSSAAVDCYVNTLVTPLLSNTYQNPTSINCGYTDGEFLAFFDSDGSGNTYDVKVAIDRNSYIAGGTITLDIFRSILIYDEQL
jgi:hypothetical protein